MVTASGLPAWGSGALDDSLWEQEPGGSQQSSLGTPLPLPKLLALMVLPTQEELPFLLEHSLQKVGYNLPFTPSQEQRGKNSKHKHLHFALICKPHA